MKARLAAGAIIGLAALGVSYSALHAQESRSESRSVWDGVYTDEQAKRGQPLYNQHCASCHGELMSGGEMAPPLAGGEFLSNWSGLTLGDLFERIRTTMPPGKPGKLSREGNADITAYMLGFNRFPAGQTDLPNDTPHLKLIRIEMTKPEPNEKK